MSITVLNGAKRYCNTKLPNDFNVGPIFSKIPFNPSNTFVKSRAPPVTFFIQLLSSSKLAINKPIATTIAPIPVPISAFLKPDKPLVALPKASFNPLNAFTPSSFKAPNASVNACRF